MYHVYNRYFPAELVRQCSGVPMDKKFHSSNRHSYPSNIPCPFLLSDAGGFGFEDHDRLGEHVRVLDIERVVDVELRVADEECV